MADEMTDPMDPMEGNEGPETEKIMDRGEPQPSEARKALVERWCKEVKADKKHFKEAFERMREDQDFAYGRQWTKEDSDSRYVANITLRHVQQRVAALYAKNPKAVARRRQRLLHTVWDGSASAIQLALQQSAEAAATGDLAGAQNAIAILQDAQQATMETEQIERLGKTLELVYGYNLEEQAHPFKPMMKLVIRRAVTTGVGYVKLGFQRVLQPRPEIEARIADATERLATMRRLAADQADGDVDDPNAPEVEELRLMIQQLQNEAEIVTREGIILDYPDSSVIIPDRRTRQLREFLGADYVTQEYCLTRNEVKEIYEVDLGTTFTRYKSGESPGELMEDTGQEIFEDEVDDDSARALVWEIWSRKDGLVYTVCDGYPEFLRDPHPPEVWTERFWPWFPVVLNECDHPKEIYPPSDVRLIRHQQMEYNRLRQGLREHRIANRPTVVTTKSSLSEEDREALQNRPANAVVELNALQPGQSVSDVLQALTMPGVDPNLYEVNGIFEDVLRTVGVQEANLGATGGDTATESSIAESARMSSLQSNIDDLDDMLTALARAAGQMLLAEMAPEMVKEIVGPGAVWPDMNREELAKEIFLEIEAGSTGRPNQAQEIQNYERLAPLLLQVPGISPELMAKEGIRRMDDRLNLEDLYDKNLPSIQAMNQIAGAAARGGPPGAGGVVGSEDPNAQGPQGANNAQQPDRPAGNPGGPEIPGPNGTTDQPLM